MQLITISLLIISILYFLIAHYLYLEYKKSTFHNYYVFLFGVMGFFYLAIYLLATSVSAEQRWFCVRLMTISHLGIPAFADSIIYLSKDRIRVNSKLKNILLYTPFIVLFLIDFSMPQLAQAGFKITNFGFVFEYRSNSIAVLIQNLIYAPALLILVVLTVLGAIKEKHQIKRRFFIFFVFSLMFPVVVFVVFSYGVSQSSDYLIPYLSGSGVFTLGIIGTYLYKYSIFDISIDIAWKDIVANMPNMLFLLDNRFNIIEINESVTKQLLYNENELKNKAFYSLLHFGGAVKEEDSILSISGSEVYVKSKNQRYINAILYTSQVYRHGHFLGYMVIGNNITNLHKLSDEKRMLQLELNALQLQMNPHFIFNSVNSIFHLISKNQLEDANKYLADLAQLMRSIMESVGVPHINVEDEIRILSMYLQLEALRFEGEFNYEIRRTGQSNISYRKIPPMIIQPFIENAIWHGLLAMTDLEERILSIEFENKQESLRVVITDNGVGLLKSRATNLHKDQKHKPRAIDNIKERIRLYNSYSGVQNIHMEILDRSEQGEAKTGTKVILEFTDKSDS